MSTFVSEFHGLPSLGSFCCLLVFEGLQELVQSRGDLPSFDGLKRKADGCFVDV